jgi:Fe2+ or Zn2+ uptake regulation protein
MTVPAARVAPVVHDQVADRLRRVGQRYTARRHEVVELLQQAGRPLTMHELLDAAGDLPMSSVYRSLSVLERAGAVTRYPTAGGHGLYELSEALVGHHHHLICTNCGRMEDLNVPPPQEGDLERVVEEIAAGRSFHPTGHRLELIGVCADCA